MKNLVTVVFIAIIFFTGCQTSKDSIVVFHTKYGDMKAILYEETPKHKANFIKLVESGKYDSTIFHRVIEDFMIQGGDVNLKPNIQEEDRVDYNIDAEINDQFWHVKGALAAARQGDQINPNKRSSGSQFYIVQGQKMEGPELDQLAEGRIYQQKQAKVRELLAMKKYAHLRNKVIEMQKNQDLEGLQSFMEEADSLIAKEFGKLEVYEFSAEQKADYETIGGAPHLDGEYTVFGRVVEGLNVIDSIAAVRKGRGDKPVEDIYLTVDLEEMSQKKITEKYGYEYSNEEK
ncbi:peptidylprolyl isomerase [Marivirga sp. S37H4]|uniref:Peptidyl-prolyl cis-trans isomerase n=1 Tax=Marivirga aurantiaca TaxID=2802615 RepID=A0A934X1L8_9BACT|nr:peptidylprolyl isomerase [Marivirga aurantiaca]MBK6266656.1 peptidylprolyl isomerase [Marivirga aurantiaca]